MSAFSGHMFPFAKGHETIRMYHQPNGYQEESPMSSTHNWLSTFWTKNWLSILMRWATIQRIVKLTYCTKRWYSWENRQRHMQNKTKKAKWRSKTELNFLLLPALPFSSNLYDTFLEENKNTFGYQCLCLECFKGL